MVVAVCRGLRSRCSVHRLQPRCKRTFCRTSFPQSFTEASQDKEQQSRELIANKEREQYMLAPRCLPQSLSARFLQEASHTDAWLDPPEPDPFPDPFLGAIQTLEQASEVLMREGLLRVNGVLNIDTAEAMRAHADTLLERSVLAVANGETPYLELFGAVMSRRRRYDVLLPLDDLVLKTAQQILELLRPLLLVSVGHGCSLCELSALVSDPGSAAQPIHHDTVFDGSHPRVSILIALQDVTRDMGPTLFFPRSNTPQWHHAHAEDGKELNAMYSKTPHVLGTMSAGDALLYDANVLHGGGANTSHGEGAERPSAGGMLLGDPGIRRSLMVLTVQVEQGQNVRIRTNMRPGYRNRYHVADCHMWKPDQL